MPPIPGLREANPLTNESVFDLTERPASIGILGAGAIGCELSLVFARLGVTVHLYELAPRVLPLETAKASEALHEALSQAGVQIHVGEGVSEIKTQAGGYEVLTSGDNPNHQVEKLMVALGRRPNTDTLNLKAAGVEQNERGFIVTDSKLRTSNSSVYAAGDWIVP